MDYIGLGRRIRTQRKLQGMTQKTLAEKAGISLPFYGHIERGTRKASLETIISIANALRVSTDLLLQDSLLGSLYTDDSDLSARQRALINDIVNVLREHDQ
ncbi:MAG: helix-turn-helix transcriptional regulator [Clostridiales bacterium]|jgi:transcriptional regulator with XRE-family HTH domain|nr:helix-turn-helix transcriptional regulator [Clostridiales bacterium]OPZ67190.1 MAG: HTH-type transcriptional regulator ImmR [Firmicutes bacterium ADurb.Bin467]